MKYYSYTEYDHANPTKDSVVTLSEKEILDMYWTYWKFRMIKKYGQEQFEKEFSEKDCIDDWCVQHWAWEANQPKD